MRIFQPRARPLRVGAITSSAFCCAIARLAVRPSLLAVTLILKRPTSLLGTKEEEAAWPRIFDRVAKVRLRSGKVPPGPAAGSWNTTSAPETGRSRSSRISTTGSVATRVLMLLTAFSPWRTTILSGAAAGVCPARDATKNRQSTAVSDLGNNGFSLEYEEL